jgi:hypothetical protein
LVNALNKVDFPTLGRPTMPHFKLMSWAALWQAFATLLLGGSLLLQAGPAQAQPVLALNDANPVMDARAAALTWIDADGQAAIEQVAAGKNGPAFTPAAADTIYSLGPNAALWLHYRFAKSSGSRQDWLLAFPLPLLDLATVYQRGAAGAWTSQTAGDTVAVSSWPEPGRYGQFELNLPDNGVHDVYVRIQHVTEVGIPVRVSTRGSQAQRLQLEYLAIGVVFGALVLLIVACAVQSWVYRDKAYGWYAVYASIMALVVAAWSGVAGHLLWSNFSAWNNLAQGCLGILGGGSALLVVHQLCGVGTRHKWFERIAYWVGVAGLPLALLYTMLERGLGVRLIGLYLIAVVVLGVGRAYMTWRRQDVVGFWVLAAFTPLALATLLVVTSILGLLSVSWLSQYGLMAGLVIEVPLLLVALNLRSRERHAVEAREAGHVQPGRADRPAGRPPFPRPLHAGGGPRAALQGAGGRGVHRAGQLPLHQKNLGHGGGRAKPAAQRDQAAPHPARRQHRGPHRRGPLRPDPRRRGLAHAGHRAGGPADRRRPDAAQGAEAGSGAAVPRGRRAAERTPGQP